jgi:Uma2 family endonuclease
MSQVIYDDLTLEQFRRLPEAKPSLEFFDGKVTQKVAAKRSHSVIQTLLCAELTSFAKREALGEAYVELRCTFGGSSIVPDLCFFDRRQVPREEDVTTPPDLIVEILSPGQTVTHASRRMEWCIDHGVRLGWLIQPSKQTIAVFHESAPKEVLGLDDVLDGRDVLPTFRLPLRDLFGWIHPATA